jgi:CheY-specific phosphatase CheX
MSHDLTPKLLQESLVCVLEEAAFVFTEPAESAPLFSGDLVRAEIAFEGAVKGNISFAVPSEIGETFAANLMAEEPGSPEVREHASEAVGEILNMVAGILLESWLGEEARYHLGTPRVRRLGELGAWPPAGSAAAISLCTEEEQPIVASVELESQGAP